MPNNVRQFFEIRVVFHTLYLWNKVGDPIFFFCISDTIQAISECSLIMICTLNFIEAKIALPALTFKGATRISFGHFCGVYCSCHRLPRGGVTPGWSGGTRGLNGDFATNFCPCGGGNFWMPYSRGKCGNFASVQLRGGWERSIVRSIGGEEEGMF